MDISTNPALVVARLEPFIKADPVLATTLGTIQAILRQPPADAAPWCASLPGSIAARSQQHTPVSLLGEWADVTELGAALTALRPDAINGPQPLVDRVAAVLRESGVPERHRIDERLFRLEELVDPVAVAGSPRRATDDDADLLVRWWGDFAAEAHDPAQAREITDSVARVLRGGRQWLWLATDGTPVSMAAGRAPVAGCGRVGPVYTPPDQRGHGYASAVTAVVTREVLQDGAVPVLFTDRSNPTSNKIYRALGYRDVDNYAFVSFDWSDAG